MVDLGTRPGLLTGDQGAAGVGAPISPGTRLRPPQTHRIAAALVEAAVFVGVPFVLPVASRRDGGPPVSSDSVPRCGGGRRSSHRTDHVMRASCRTGRRTW